MELSRGLHEIELVETEFDTLTKNPEIYVEPQPDKADCFKHLSEKLYRSAVSVNKNLKGRFLSKLLIHGFDAEQIWQQCDLLNNAAFPNISLAVRNINFEDINNTLSKTSRAPPSVSHVDNKTDSDDDEDAFSNSGSSAGGEYVFDDDSDSPPTELEAFSKDKPSKEKKVPSSSQVDDKFFKLSELEEFLKLEDLKEERGIEDSGDDDINLFQDIPSDDMEDFDEEREKPVKFSKDLMYDDFFDDPEAEVEDEKDSIEDDNESIMKENYKASLDENDSAVQMKDDLEKSDGSEGESTKLEDKNVQKTAFELEQEKIQKKIQEYEKSMIEPLPWHLTGEVDASKRPVDSLIHKEIDFDSNVKEDLIVDNALTESIENLVKMAIRNKAFNDVERKYKSTEDVIAYKKEAALDQTKSKKSLAEVYEDDYLKKQKKQEEEKDPKHKEIKKLMDSLFPELYALFTHIPVPAIPELKVISNLPAVTVEEVAPVTLNDATLLAPEEVKKKSGQIKSKTERTDTDRKRERRKKKVHQKLKEKKRIEKLESQKGNPSAKVTKLEKLQTLKKLKQHKNTKIASVDDGGKIKSSKDFFSRLQDTVDSKNRTKTQNFPKKKKK